MYNKQFFDLFTKDLRLVIDDFDAHGFVSQIMDDEWEGRELKQRWIHITSILKKFLPYLKSIFSIYLFATQIYVFFLKGQALKTEVSHKKDCSSLIPYIL